jgi:hypothetical protein
MEGSWRHLGKETEVPGGAKQKGADEEEADKDFYAFLNLSPDCTLDDIKTAYKRLALIWHPDRHSDQVSREHATAKFARLTYINEILIDPSKRQVCTHTHLPLDWNAQAALLTPARGAGAAWCKFAAWISSSCTPTSGPPAENPASPRFSFSRSPHRRH